MPSPNQNPQVCSVSPHELETEAYMRSIGSPVLKTVGEMAHSDILSALYRRLENASEFLCPTYPSAGRNIELSQFSVQGMFDSSSSSHCAILSMSRLAFVHEQRRGKTYSS